MVIVIQAMAFNNKHNMYLKVTTVFLLVTVFMAKVTEGQFPGLANEIFGPSSIVTGVKNLMGGIRICEEFSDEVVEMTEEVDPVKRTIVHVPKVVQRRGRLRWIGDLVANGVTKVANALKVNPYGFRRRQGGAPATLAAKAVEFVVANWNKIPINQIFHVLDLGADVTNTFNRQGGVYPIAKSATIGYGYGHRRDDKFTGVCTQVAPDCGDMWSHLEKCNGYSCGALSRKATEDFTRTNTRSSGLNSDDPLHWNSLKTDEVSNPRVFLCKAGMFMEHVTEKMDAERVMIKERFGPEEFQDTCDPKHLGKGVAESEDAFIAAADPGDDAEIIEIRSTENASDTDPIFGTEAGFKDLPVLVFEGLPPPNVDQTEEELVESVLKIVNIPKTAVRTAIRLPLVTRGKSIVLVEMENEEEREEIIEQKDKLRTTRNSLVKVGIRRARYKELWKFVRQLMVIKEINPFAEQLKEEEKEEEETTQSNLEQQTDEPTEEAIVEDTNEDTTDPGDDVTIIDAHKHKNSNTGPPK